MVMTSPEWLERHHIDEEDLGHWANVVLGWAGDGGWYPSAWEFALIRLISLSDSDNQEVLLRAFPGAVGAFIIYKERDTQELRRLAGLEASA